MSRLSGVVVLFLSSAVIAADNPWRLIEPADLAGQVAAAREPWVHPDRFQAVSLDAEMMRAWLAASPAEFGPQPVEPHVLTLPMPDGTFTRFSIVESPVMEPGLAAQFPEIKTYLGQGLDDPAATLRCDFTPHGFHAQVLSPNGNVYIDPYWKGDITQYTSYHKKDLTPKDMLLCLTDQGGQGGVAAAAVVPLLGENLRTYRLAVAATGEYTNFHGGTVALGLAAIVTAVNRVTGVYENDLSVRMVLVANNNLIVYTNAATDPYTNSDGGAMLGQNQSNLNSVIGSANYDIGHVFSTGGGGVASLGVVCVGSSKARGVTGLPSPTGDAFYIDYVAHEMGHQYGGNHCFNSVTSSCCCGNRNGGTAYEPGSGSSIMAYAGICGSDNLQPNSDAMFHSISLQEMASFVAGGSGSICDQSTPTGNSVPTADAGQNYTIPRSTPFELTAVATDVDGDTITYSWEQRDLGAATTLAAPDNGTSPIERTWPPTTNPVRTIPRLSNLLTNTVPLGEKLPTANRTMDWRLVVRDNRAGGGGVATDDMIVTVTTTSGPFAVTFPNTAVTLSGSEVITWNVANTTASPVNAAAVDILLSTDGGLTFPTALAEGVPNDGSELVVLPDTPTTTARIKVKGKGNIFFDLSNTNFTIQSCAPLPSLQPDPSGTDKNRFVSLTPPFSASAAIRVNLTDLPPPFEAFEGQVRWVGPPTEYVDPVWGNSTWTAPLQCDPYFGAWSTVDVLHIYDPAIVPNGVYDIDASECGTEEGSFSPILQVVTSGWGDVVDPFDGPSAVDIAAVVDRVANLPGAIPRVSAKLQPNLVVPSANPSALDIADAVDANQGDSYPYAGPTACP